MLKILSLLLTGLLIACLNLVNLASILPQHRPNGYSASNNQVDKAQETLAAPTQPSVPGPSLAPPASGQTIFSQQTNAETMPTSTATPLRPTTISATTIDPDEDSPLVQPSGSQDGPANSSGFSTHATPNREPTSSSNNPSSGNHLSIPPNGTSQTPKQAVERNQGESEKLEWSILFYSLFIVYVSFVKLIYHNIQCIKNNMTEPGILMLFGIVWELIVPQLSSNHAAFPRFNPRIFFYLFLPSTVLESASLLSNKWLFFNLFPILSHSILGTMLYALSLGFTIYSLSQASLFTTSHPMIMLNQSSSIPQQTITSAALSNTHQFQPFGLQQDPSSSSQHQPTNQITLPELLAQQQPDKTQQQNNLQSRQSMHWTSVSELNLSDCYILATMLAAIDSAPMLNVFKHYQVNEKLYYLVLGENLMNNAVVIVLFNLFLHHFEANKLSIVQVYLTSLEFFATLIGGLLIGLLLAAFTLVCVRFMRRFQVPDAISSYHNQCQAMVETLLILKLAYLAYTLANLAGTSSIVSLATFGILNDQYIKQNLNLRSQLTFRQVILATKTMGFSLVYPLLGMLLVEVANGGRLSQRLLDSSNNHLGQLSSSKLSSNDAWNFKFLWLVCVLAISYRFLIVIALSLVSNLLTCGQAKIKLREQVLMAYGGLKGPLTVALLHRLLDHRNYKLRTAHNKHLFIYTILSITLISTALMGALIRPLVARIQMTLGLRAPAIIEHINILQDLRQHSASSDNNDSRKRSFGRTPQHRAPTVLFDMVNHKLTEYVSHGLNTILGHSRSPYDKFAEFNETHIKPWLARTGSNTNWLAVFYDNLVLDETLNSNCFYVATEDPTTLRTHFATNQQPGKRFNLNHQTSTVSGADNSRQAKSNQMKLQAGPSRFSAILDKINSNQAGTRETLLREFVMLHLKMENSRRLRKVQNNAVKPEESDSNPLDVQTKRGSVLPNSQLVMINSTSSSLVRAPSGDELAIKHMQLNKVAEQLSNRHLDEEHPVEINNHELARALTRRRRKRRRRGQMNERQDQS